MILNLHACENYFKISRYKTISTLREYKLIRSHINSFILNSLIADFGTNRIHFAPEVLSEFLD